MRRGKPGRCRQGLRCNPFRTLEVSIVGYADEIAAAASLLQGQADEGQPVVLVRGLRWSAPNAPVAELIRPPEEDLFQ